MIHLGDQAAVVVPVTDFLRLRALTTFVPADEARRRLGMHAVLDAIAVRHMARGTGS